MSATAGDVGPGHVHRRWLAAQRGMTQTLLSLELVVQCFASLQGGIEDLDIVDEINDLHTKLESEHLLPQTTCLGEVALQTAASKIRQFLPRKAPLRRSVTGCVRSSFPHEAAKYSTLLEACMVWPWPTTSSSEEA